MIWRINLDITKQFPVNYPTSITRNIYVPIVFFIFQIILNLGHTVCKFLHLQTTFLKSLNFEIFERLMDVSFAINAILNQF